VKALGNFRISGEFALDHLPPALKTLSNLLETGRNPSSTLAWPAGTQRHSPYFITAASDVPEFNQVLQLAAGQRAVLQQLRGDPLDQRPMLLNQSLGVGTAGVLIGTHVDHLEVVAGGQRRAGLGRSWLSVPANALCAAS
jgi:hypothetical protein